MGDRTVYDRVRELEDLVSSLSERLLVLEGEKEKRERARKQGLMVREGGKWVRKEDA